MSSSAIAARVGVSTSGAVESEPRGVGCCQPFCDLEQAPTCPGADQVGAPLLERPPAEFVNVGSSR